MPARKPNSLNKRHDTRADNAERTAAETAMQPRTLLTIAPPPGLKGHKFAAALWKRTVGLYLEVDGTIATAFDEDLLTKYCILEEECLWLEGKRNQVDKKSADLDRQITALTKRKLADDGYKMLYKLYEQYNALTARVQGLDARLDGKRKLVFSIAQSLYLTPRSRAGVAPTEKPPEKQKSKLSAMLDK